MALRCGAKTRDVYVRAAGDVRRTGGSSASKEVVVTFDFVLVGVAAMRYRSPVPTG